jgi:multimeric flavodoxin WrbA
MQPEPSPGPRTLVIMGSARGDGNTRRAVDRLCRHLADRVTVVDLSALFIAPFSYAGVAEDDFLPIVDRMLAHEQIVFATPVYWYAMSGLMKTFFDRITDLLLDPDKRGLARSLAGREAWLLATGTGEALPAGFHEPFAGTAAYLDMRWREAFYIRSSTELAPADQLARLLET